MRSACHRIDGLVRDGSVWVRARTDIRRICLEITTRCNLHCDMCLRRAWADEAPCGEHMSHEIFEAVLHSASILPRLRTVHLAGFGEPLHHPRILDYIARLKNAGLRVGLSTNGTRLDRETVNALVDLSVDRIVVSVDSLDDRQFSSLRRGGALPAVIEGIQLLDAAVQQRRRGIPRLEIETVLSRENAHQASRIVQFARAHNTSSVLFTHLLPHRADQMDRILYTGPDEDPGATPATSELLAGDGADYSHHVRLPRDRWGTHRRCPFVHGRWVAVGVRGGVSPCYALLHSHPVYIFGRRKWIQRWEVANMREADVASIWMRRDYVRFRTQVELFQFPSCLDCSLYPTCDYAAANANCWGDEVSCADCLWAQDIIRCP